MTYFADLTPYCYGSSRKNMLNVGWLDPSHPFPVELVEPKYLRALIICAKFPKALYRGTHRCHLDDCQTWGTEADCEGIQVRCGNGEIRVKAEDDRIYAAPTMIAHYVQVHHYQPPEIFLRAVMKLAEKIPILTPSEIKQIQELPICDCYQLILNISKIQQERMPSFNYKMHEIYAWIGHLIQEESWTKLEVAWNDMQTQRAGFTFNSRTTKVEGLLQDFARFAGDPGWHDELRDATAHIVERALSWEIRIPIP